MESDGNVLQAGPGIFVTEAKKEPAKISVQRDGDDQLWTVNGKLNDGFQWTLPITAKPHRTITEPPEPSEPWYFVFGANYNWSPRQYEELSCVLDRYDCCPADPRGWWYRQEVLEKFAVKAPGINPDFYIRWPGYETPSYNEIDTLELPEEPGFNKAELNFLKHLQRMTGTQSWEALKFFWINFRKQAILWMAVERRPLDLGFIRLVPMPYRANWKEALTVRFSGLMHCFRGETRQDRQEILQAGGFFEALSSVKLLAVEKEKVFCRWTVESLPSHDLELAIEEQEYRKFQRIGPAGYARHILRSMADRIGDTMRIFTRYAQAVCLPPGRRMEAKNGFGVEIIVPDLAPGRIRPGHGIAEQIDLSPTAFTRLTDTQQPYQSSEIKPMKVKVPDFLRNVRPFKELSYKGDINGRKEM